VGSKSKNDIAGAKYASVDLTDVAKVADILRDNKVEVVVSTIGSPGLPSQPALGDAAKLVGVKLFVPSEFGYSSIGRTEGMLGQKDSFAEYLKEIGLPSTRIICGLFTNYIPWLVELGSGKVKIIGKGDKRGSFTALDDVAGFTAHVLTTLPSSELDDTVFRLQGDVATLREIATFFEGKFPFEYVDKLNDPFPTMVQDHIESGGGEEYEGEGDISNGMWEGHQWKTIQDVLNTPDSLKSTYHY